MKLSIAFITYNRGTELVRAIESCFPIGIKEYEIIIWDNNSKDDEKRKIQDYVENAKGNIKYYYSDKNLGVAGGRNSVWKKCSGEYVFFLDDDAVIKNEDFFQKLVQYMDMHRRVAAAGIRTYEPATKSYLVPKQQFVGKDGYVQILTYIGCAFILRHENVKKDYLYPEKLMFGSEEYYSSMLLWNEGYEIHLYNGGMVFHMPSEINRCAGAERKVNIISNTHLVRLLTYPAWMKPILNFTLVWRVKNNKLSMKACRALIAKRFDSKEINRIQTRTIMKLLNKFGLFNII